ncbi:MAG: hypothetical protein ACXWUR_01260 [Allosphingosinicella sp.]
MTEPNVFDAIAATPHWLPHELDPATDRTVLLHMDEEDYRRASFLDQRAIGPDARLRAVDWRELAAAVPDEARRDVQYIFHIGNVGSTLISRLLGELDAVFALREPLLLRNFLDRLGPLAAPAWGEAEAAARLTTLTALLSRTFQPGQRALVKATSFTSEIAWRLLPRDAAALFLFATPQHYVENILAGQNSRQTLDLLSPMRLARLQRRCPGLALDLATLPDARRAALGWACEMSSLEESAARRAGEPILWLDFDRFLIDPVAHFTVVARHFGHEVAPDRARAIADGPLMRLYSKALEYEFNPAARQDTMAEARWQHGPAIRDALAWLDQLAGRHEAIAQAIRRAQ